MRSEERDDDVPGPTPPTAEPRPNLAQRESVAESSAEIHQRQARGVLALPTKGAVIVRIIDVRECRGFEACEFHARERSAVRLWTAWV
jgi:hypothetical protein